jgi:hypothetical protein
MGVGKPFDAFESAFFTQIGDVEAVHFDGL